MSKQFIDTSVSATARIACIIQNMTGHIEKFEKFLSGEQVPPEWKGVNRNQIESALKYAQDCLSDATSEESIQLIAADFMEIRKKYIKKES